jgi:hypothetical protein
MSADIIDFPEDGPRTPVRLPYAATHAVELLRYALRDLKTQKRINRSWLNTWIGNVIKELEGGLKSAAEESTGDFSKVLLQALRPGVTVSEIQGARAILELILAALPVYEAPPPDPAA